MTAVYKADLLGGVTAIDTEILVRKNSNATNMYNEVKKPVFETIKTRLVPNYAWSNRGRGEMTVFLPVIWSGN